MGMVMLFGLAAGLIVLALISWLLSAFTSISFGHWMLLLPLVLFALGACSASLQWAKEQNQDTGLPLTLVDEQVINPALLFPYDKLDDLNDDLSDEDKQLKQQAEKTFLSPRWSYSHFATTNEIKISTASSADVKFLEVDGWHDEDGHHGYLISYPDLPSLQRQQENPSQSEQEKRFFITEHIIKPEGGVNTRLLTWVGELSDKVSAIELSVEGKVGGMTVEGVDETQSIISVSFDYHSQRQVFLFDHASGEMRPITEKREVASAKLEWANDWHYMTVVSINRGEVLLAVYSDAKDYDDFFSSRGRSLPRISQLLLISEQYPQGQLLSRLRLAEQGMLIAISENDGQLLLETLDQRDLEQQTLRHFSVDPKQLNSASAY